MNKKIAVYDGDEYEQIINFARPFWKNALSSEPPKLMVYMGGIGSGKTTLRKKEYCEEYVHLDFGDIIRAARKFFGPDHPRLSGYAKVAGDLILEQSLLEKRNMVIEVVPYDLDIFYRIVNKMKEQGYSIILKEIDCDSEEGAKRHEKAATEESDYISAYHTQPALFAAFNSHLS